MVARWVQPSHDHAALCRTNVSGSKRLLRAAADAQVPPARLGIVGRGMLRRPEGPGGRRALTYRRNRHELLRFPDLAPPPTGRGACVSCVWALPSTFIT